MAKSTENQCAFFLKGKGRYCRLEAVKGTQYCGEHMLSGGVDLNCSGEKRVVCPLDPSHTVYEHLINKHLRKCNAAKRQRPTCYIHNINSGLLDYRPSPEEQFSLQEFSEERLDELISQVEASYDKLYEEIETTILDHAVLNEELANDINGPSALKHLKQQASIIGHMEHLGLLAKDTFYVEFGAGRGKLSHWIQLALSQEDTVHYTLIDRENCRRKMDLYHRFESQGPKFERLLIDIEHLNLCHLESLHNGSYKHVVGISKHLCGAATDLTLRCLTRFHHEKQQYQSKTALNEKETIVTSSCQISCPPPLGGILIALCCHQRCDWKSFFGQEVLSELGFNAIDFHIISHMTSWAVCGARPEKLVMTTNNSDEVIPEESHTNPLTVSDHTTSMEYKTKGNMLVDKKPDEVEDLPKDDHKTMTIGTISNLSDVPNSSLPEPAAVPDTVIFTNVLNISSTSDVISASSKKGFISRSFKYIPHIKEPIGLKCKRLLDLARMHSLRRCGFHCKLVHYVDKTVSLENVLLIAIPI